MLQLSRGHVPEAQEAVTPEPRSPEPSTHPCSCQSPSRLSPSKALFLCSLLGPNPLHPVAGGLGKAERLPLRYASLGTKRGAWAMLREDSVTMGRRNGLFFSKSVRPKGLR